MSPPFESDAAARRRRGIDNAPDACRNGIRRAFGPSVKPGLETHRRGQDGGTHEKKEQWMPSHVAVVWNPSKTEREPLEAGLTAALGEESAHRVDWWETTPEDPGQAVTARALAAGATLIIVAGGDGTARAVAEHLADTVSRAELAIVPLGTGNLLARNLDVPISDVPAAFVRALGEDTRPVDVGWVEVELDSGVERHAFLVMIGFGIDAHMIAETDEDLKDKAGWLAYVESLGRALAASETVPFHITTDGSPARDQEGHTLLIANCGTLQGGLMLMPDADPSDGMLDYLVLSAEGVGEWLGTMKTMMWDNGLKRLITRSDEVTSTDSVGHGRAATIEVTLPEPRAFEIDGEEIGETTSFSVTIQPSAIRVR